MAAPAMMPGKVHHAEACWHEEGRTSMSNFKNVNVRRIFAYALRIKSPLDLGF